jgi:hypothetical protein
VADPLEPGVGPGPEPGPLSLEESARIVGGYSWLELRLFETLGGWVPSVPEVEVKLRLHSDAPKHAWHAQLWRDLLPRDGELAAEGITVPPSPGAEAFVDALAAAADPGQSVEKLVGVYRVALPRQVATYRAHRARISPVSDGPVARALELVLRDEVADWQEGEMLLQSLLTSDEAARRAAAHQGRLESLLAGEGLSGPGALPGLRTVGPP